MEPDGFIRMEVSEELANCWDPVEYPNKAKQTYDFLFKHMRDKSDGMHDCCRSGWSTDSIGITFYWDPKGEMGFSNRQTIPWRSILNFEVIVNSDKYIEWRRANRDR